MKKIALSLLVLTLALFLAAPAMADFNPYGSARMMTFYVTDSPAVGDDDKDTVWDLQGNSRIGAKFTTGDVAGHFEYGTGVNLRQLYGTVKLGGGTLLIGQTYTPYAYGSDQVANEDWGFDGFGDTYEGRKPQIVFTMDSGLYFGAIKPEAAEVSATSAPTPVVGAPTPYFKPDTIDLDTTLPKLCVGYDTKLDGTSLGGGIAYNSFNEENLTTGFDESIDSMLLYFHVNADLGEVSLKANFGYGTNLGNFGFTDEPSPGAVVVAGKVEDTTTMLGYVQATFKAGDTPIKLGVGYASSDNDTYKDPDAQMSYFVNATISLADNFFIVPELSMFDYMDDETGAEENDVMWVGVKWQMNF